MKKYLVLGSNNFWYATTTNLKIAKEIRREILDEEKYMHDFNFADPESSYHPKQPQEVYIFKSDKSY